MTDRTEPPKKEATARKQDGDAAAALLGWSQMPDIGRMRVPVTLYIIENAAYFMMRPMSKRFGCPVLC
jgi:hypothetical protein